MTIQFVGLPTPIVDEIRQGKRDAYGHAPERHLSEGAAYPCRHCLRETPPGRDYLILAHRPFATLNPYTETGPIFLCADDCEAHEPSQEAPSILRSPRYMVRGYTANERILYGTGDIVATPEIAPYAETLLQDPKVAFVDIRSASNNCFQCRVLRQS